MSLNRFLQALWQESIKVAPQHGLTPLELYETLVMAAHLEGGLGETAAVGDEGYSVGRFQFYTNGGHGSTLLNQGYTREQIADDVFQAKDWTPIMAQSLARTKANGLSGIQARAKAIFDAERPAEMYPTARVNAAANALRTLEFNPGRDDSDPESLLFTGNPDDHRPTPLNAMERDETTTFSPNPGDPAATQIAPNPDTGGSSMTDILGALLGAMMKRPAWSDEAAIAAALKANPKLTREAVQNELFGTWMEQVGQIQQALTAFRLIERDVYTTPEGYQIPGSQVPPQLKSIIQKSNENIARDILNKFNLSVDDLKMGRWKADLDAKTQTLNSKIAVGNLTLSQANAQITRYLGGAAEARQRADFVQRALMEAKGWAAPEGKTAFTWEDLGLGGVMGMMNNPALGIQGPDPSGLALQYSGQMKVDPASILAEYDRQMGLEGGLPGIPKLGITQADVPVPGELPPTPELLRPNDLSGLSLPSSGGLPPGVQLPGSSSAKPKKTPEYGSSWGGAPTFPWPAGGVRIPPTAPTTSSGSSGGGGLPSFLTDPRIWGGAIGGLFPGGGSLAGAGIGSLFRR